MILRLDEIEISQIDKKTKPIIDFFLSDKIIFPSILYSIVIQVETNKFQPVYYINDLENKERKSSTDFFLIIDNDLSKLQKLINLNKLSFNENYKKLILQLLKYLTEKKFDIEKNNYYRVFSTMFLMSFFRIQFIEKPSILLFILWILSQENPDILKYLKNCYNYCDLLCSKDFLSNEFFIYLISIEADDSLLKSIQKLLIDFSFNNSLKDLFHYVLICKLNKNRLRRFINELYRVNDISELSSLLNLLKNDDSFFHNIQITPSQKEIKLTNIIEKLINPQSFDKHQNYIKLINSMKHSVLNIKPSPYFESNEITINASIKNNSELEILKNEINDLIKYKDKLFEC